MLNVWCLRKASSVLLPLFLLAGCSDVVIPEQDKVEVHRSAAQELVINNLTTGNLVLFPVEGAAQPLPVGPGAQATIGFVVITMKESIRRAGNGVEGEGELFNTVEAPAGEATEYLATAGEDVILKVEREGDIQWSYRFNFGPCWFDEPAHTGRFKIDIAEEPLPLAEHFCPPSASSQ